MSSQQSPSVGQMIRKLRTDARWSQERLAESVGGKKNQAWVSAIERGTYSPQPDDLRRIAEAFGVPYNTLAVAAGYAEPDDPDAPPTPRQQIIDDLMRMAQTRPDLMDTLVRLREENDEETYQRAIAIVHRFLISSLETVRDTFEAPAHSSPTI